MRSNGRVCAALAAMFGLCWAAAAHGQAVRPAVETREPAGPFKMVIYSGPNRTVHYFPGNVGPGDAATLHELQRSENELAYLDSLQALRRQYVDHERYLEPGRTVVQDHLYGLAINNNFSSYYSAPGYYGGYGYGGYAYPSVTGGYGVPWPAYGASGSGSVSRSLANGVGDEGRLKDALVQTIAAQASPEYGTGVVRAYDGALVRAAESDDLRAVAGVTGRGGRPVPAGFEKAPQATLVLKSGNKLEGTLVRDDTEWLTVRTAKEEVTVRKSEVTQIIRPVAPARP